MPSRNRTILQEQALAAWRFQPSNTAKNQDANAARIFQAFQRDMERVTRALERQLNSRPEEGVITSTSSASMSRGNLGNPSEAAVEVKATLEVLDFKSSQFEVPDIRIPPVEALPSSCNSQRSIPAMNNFISKRRPRRGNRAPITIMMADPAEFQAMVQQMTGFPPENISSKAAPPLLKPQPKRPGRIGCNISPSILPTVNSSSWGLPVAINDVFGARPSYLHPAAFCNNLAEHSVYSNGTATSSSHINSIEIDKANTLESQINASSQMDFWNEAILWPVPVILKSSSSSPS